MYQVCPASSLHRVRGNVVRFSFKLLLTKMSLFYCTFYYILLQNSAQIKKSLNVFKK